MNCPHCNVPLVMAERQGIEIDHCTRCRGVWLDRGELDKIIERANAAYPAVAPGAPQSPPAPAGYYRRDDDDDDDDHRRYNPDPRGYPPQQHYPHRKKSFWSELRLTSRRAVPD